MAQDMLGSRQGPTSTLSTCAQCRFGGMGCQAERAMSAVATALRPIRPVTLLTNRYLGSPALACRRGTRPRTARRRT